MYKIHDKQKILVNKNKTAVNPRIPMDDFLGLPAFDMVFAWNTPDQLYLTGRDAYAKHCLTADRRKYGVYDLVLTINGKKKRLYNELLRPQKGFEVDHIGGKTNDIRPEVLRILTHKQNLQNRDNVDQGEVLKHEEGFYFVRFPRDPDASKVQYEHREEATEVLYALQDKHYGEYGKRRSKELADKYDTHLFDDIFLSMFSSADYDLIHELEEAPFIYEIDNSHFYYNEAKIDLIVLNAEYMYLFNQAIKALEADMITADADERAELCRVLSWLQDGRYIINMGYFDSEFNEIVCKHLAYVRACERAKTVC